MDFDGPLNFTPEARKEYHEALKKWQKRLKNKRLLLEKRGVHKLEEEM